MVLAGSANASDIECSTLPHTLETDTMRKAIAFGLLAGVIALGAPADASAQDGSDLLAVGEMAPDFALPRGARSGIYVPVGWTRRRRACLQRDDNVHRGHAGCGRECGLHRSRHRAGPRRCGGASTRELIDLLNNEGPGASESHRALVCLGPLA